MGHGFIGLGGPLVMVLLWGGIVALLVYSIRSVTGSLREREGEEPAISILARRYASGELSTEEYVRMKEDILKGGR